MGADPRLLGQQVTIRVVAGAQVVTEINSITNFNHNTVLEIKQDGFLGEVTDRYDQVFSGYKGDFEVQPNTSDHYNFTTKVEEKAKRIQPSLAFNIIVTEFYPNGQTAIITYMDVVWGGIGDGVGSRKDFKKGKFEWACGERSLQLNNLI